MQSILSICMDLEASILLPLMSRDIHVVSVSHVAHAAPVFRATLFNAVILGYSVTEKMSQRELRTFVRNFGDSLVLVSGNAISPNQKSLVQLSPGTVEPGRNGKPAQLLFELQEVFQSTTTTAAQVSLQSWKEISAYMGRGIRTLQRWEKKFGLPIHRPSHRERSAIFALRAELDEWMRSTRIHHLRADELEEPKKQSRKD
ncbi:MAG: tolB protein [Acidobacteriales bacterium]|nr:tolB protein [Terriglobales bacterium]